MKKTILVLAVGVFSIASVQAQKSTSLSIAGSIGIPVSSPSVYSLAVGGDLQADFAATEGLKITLSGGYENLSVKSKYGGGSTGIIPLLAGAKFNLGSEQLYGHAQLGYGFGTAKGSSGAFAFAPSIGYVLSENFDLSLKYLAFSSGGTFGSINLRLAYDF